jgi:hypothetical protein
MQFPGFEANLFFIFFVANLSGLHLCMYVCVQGTRNEKVFANTPTNN